MAGKTLTDLPSELLIEIVDYLRPSLDDLPTIGVGAPWASIEGSLNMTYDEWDRLVSKTDETTSEESNPSSEAEQEGNVDAGDESPQPESNMIAVDELEAQPPADEVATDDNQAETDTGSVSRHTECSSQSNSSSANRAALIALRSISSAFNALCTPYIYQDLRLFKAENLNDVLNLAVIPYSHLIKTLRITGRLSDNTIAQVLKHTLCVNSILFYELGSHVEETGRAVVNLLANGSLEALGFYDFNVLEGSWGWDLSPLGPAHVIEDIGESQKASDALKKLDLVVYGIDGPAYRVIRRHLPNIQDLTLYGALTENLSDGIWNSDQQINWMPYSHLKSLQLRACAIANAQHIPHLVRQFPALTHLLVSVCGQDSDSQLPSPPQGWFQSSDALWKVHEPLDTFHIEHTITWEIACMAEIPVKNLIIANLRGDFLIEALDGDPNYFPCLQTIRIQPETLGYYDKAHPFNEKTLEALIKYCQRRGVELRRDAEAISLLPRHHF